MVRIKAEDEIVLMRVSSRIVADVIRVQIEIQSKPIYDEDLPLLVEVARTHNVPRKERSHVLRIAELFDHHFVLGYRNGQEWYDLHPLVRRSPKVQAALEKAMQGHILARSELKSDCKLMPVRSTVSVPESMLLSDVPVRFRLALATVLTPSG